MEDECEEVRQESDHGELSVPLRILDFILKIICNHLKVAKL